MKPSLVLSFVYEVARLFVMIQHESARQLTPRKMERRWYHILTFFSSPSPTLTLPKVPFIFKDLVDSLSETTQAAAAVAATGGVPLEAGVGVPVALVLGYGIARSTASGATEVRTLRERR